MCLCFNMETTSRYGLPPNGFTEATTLVDWISYSPTPS
jgi:hypothetical protein